MSKQRCIWCNAVRDHDAKRQDGEDVLDYLGRKLGPLGCNAPDGDGHVWHNEQIDRILEGDDECRESGGENVNFSIWNLSNYERKLMLLRDGMEIRFYLDGKWRVEDAATGKLIELIHTAVGMAAWLNNHEAEQVGG